MYSKIDSLFWKDRKVRMLNDKQKLLMLYILTCPHRNILGYYYLPKPYIQADLKWSEADVKKGLDRLSDLKVIRYDPDNEVIFILNFIRYNSFENLNQVKGAAKCLSAIPKTSLENDLFATLQECRESMFEGKTEGFENSFETLMQTLCDRVSNTVTVTVTEAVSVNSIPQQKRYARDNVQTYGEYSNVRLSDTDYEKLKHEFPIDYNIRIETLSEYMASKGISYKNHLATIRSWARKETSAKNGAVKPKPVNRKVIVEEIKR